MHAIRIISASLLLSVGLAIAQVKPAPGDFQFERPGADASAAFPPATFPHWRHRINYRCDACHDGIFKMQRGANPVTMKLIKEGAYCGACHNGKVAFASSFKSCNRCHVSNGK